MTRVLAWVGEGELGTRGLGQEWERDFLVFVYPFVPLEFSLCAWIKF